MAMAVVRNEGVDEHGVARLLLNRPHKGNALDDSLFRELPIALRALDDDPQVRVVLLSGSGPNFCSGIDTNILSTKSSSSPSSSSGDGDGARGRERFGAYIRWLQDSLSAPEVCRKPVIAMIHGACIGGGIDLITACDVRYCTRDSLFSVKEVDLGITADLGSLQRLPAIVGYANTMELALTARNFDGKEAKELGLVSRVFDSRQEMEAAVGSLAGAIAGKSELAVRGTKAVLVKGRDMSVAQGLDYVAARNSASMSFQDVAEAIRARKEKRKPAFSKL
ncbi:delta(3,5)-Delta(2,4)-dienoyl-CoA isomerase, peroxisomal [Selaginella moellendorffii]|nr:delta(3,5)-Delta(2,4)-dienoyl-CoA isomerase, peroxisomal [Selaginella moellendorffii]|eukprot:XP_002992146.2 delta(3,5)-Delta(2,4)-dienoyl-CoA isomerase, peroxisomal [Selaginella moellendorffii]